MKVPVRKVLENWQGYIAHAKLVMSESPAFRNPKAVVVYKRARPPITGAIGGFDGSADGDDTTVDIVQAPSGGTHIGSSVFKRIRCKEITRITFLEIGKDYEVHDGQCDVPGNESN